MRGYQKAALIGSSLGLTHPYKLLSRVLSIQCGTWVFPNTPPHAQRITCCQNTKEILYQQFRLVVLTLSPAFNGGRNLIGGTKMFSRKNIEWPAFFPKPWSWMSLICEHSLDSFSHKSFIITWTCNLNSELLNQMINTLRSRLVWAYFELMKNSLCK